MTNVRSPWQGGGLWPNPEKDKVYWKIYSDFCGKKIVQWKDDREDLEPDEIIRYGTGDRRRKGRISLSSPVGNSLLFPDVYDRNGRRD
jgi:hypothetical protein